LGGYPGNDDAGRELQKKRTRKEMLEDFIAAYEYLKSHKDCNGFVGVVGFCFGGWISNMMAVRIPTLSAAVPYSADNQQLKKLKKLRHPYCFTLPV
jgi:carboxymethylenebutenolidase